MLSKERRKKKSEKTMISTINIPKALHHVTKRLKIVTLLHFYGFVYFLEFGLKPTKFIIKFSFTNQSKIPQKENFHHIWVWYDSKNL